MKKYDKSEQLEAAVFRPAIDLMILEGKSPLEIAKKICIDFDVELTPAAVSSYKTRIFDTGKSTVAQIARMSVDLSKAELPPNNVSDKLSFYFSFQKAVDDLDILYDRIRRLKVAADNDIEEPSYDKRIKENIAQCEAIRVRVFRHQYENIRKAAIMTVGKKIISAAISILIPYIHKDHRREAMGRFQSAIEPLLDEQMVPDIPSDISSV
jgi:hypothetical protein